MRRIVACLLTLAWSLSAAAHDAVAPYCPPGATFVITVDGNLLCTVPPAPCKLPQVQVCTSPTRCSCEAPERARPCTASITYPVGQPAAARLQPMEWWCDAAGLELAIAKVLARQHGDPD